MSTLPPSRKLRPKLHQKARELHMSNMERMGKIPVLKETMRGILLPEHLDHPQEVSIELTSACNADCIMCPRKDMDRKMAPMDFDLYKSVVDQCVELGVKKIFPNGYGEITTMGHERVRKYLGYIRDKSPTIEIGINSNGMLMDEEMCRIFIEKRVNWINITLDGATAETYEQVRRYLKLDQVEGNVKRLRQMRDDMGVDRPLVILHIIRMKETADEVEAFKQKWAGQCDSLYVMDICNRAGTMESQRDMLPNQGYPACFHLWNSFNVLADGTVALCCNDWNGKEPLGNMKTHSMYEIWHHPRIKELRELHLAGKAGEIPLCKDCDSFHEGPAWWRDDTVLEKLKIKAQLPALAEPKPQFGIS